MPRRKDQFVACPACGRLMDRKQGQECLSCRRLFHSHCLIRVKKRRGENGRPGRLSYNICRECFEEKPGGRVLTGHNSKIVGEPS